MYKSTCCYICLSIDKRTIDILKTDLQYVYENLANYKLSDDECWVCYICHTRLRQCWQLQQLMLQTRGLAEDIFQNKTDVKFEVFGSCIELSATKTKITSTLPPSEDMKLEAGHESELQNDDVKQDDTDIASDESESQYPFDVTQELHLESNVQDKSKVLKLSIGNISQSVIDKCLRQSVRAQPLTEVYVEIKREASDDQSEIENDGTTVDTGYKGSTPDEQYTDWRRAHGETDQLGEICSKNYTYQSELLHVRTHKSDYSCNVCSKTFTQVGNLNKHKLIHSGDKPFSCKICPKKFTQKTSLDRHLRYHTGERPYTCDICYKSFTEKGNLNSHIKSHVGGKPYTCDICSKEYAMKSNLKRHIRGHKTEKFTCDVCAMVFSFKSQLNEHFHVHVVDNMITCYICSKTFAGKSSFKRHLLIHTGDKPHTCGVCFRKFTQKSTLNKHIQIHK